MSSKPTGKRVEREARLRWVPLTQMRLNPLAQRELKQARVDKLVDEMDLEQLGSPTVNHRVAEDLFYIIDGQHRIEAYKAWNGEGNWENQQLQCWTYSDMPEEEEAEAFLRLNDTLTVTVFDKFRVGVRAGRAEDTDIDRIVRAAGLKVSRVQTTGAIRAVGTLRRVYEHGPGTLARTLRIIRDSFGDAGFDAAVIDGIGLLCHRYNGDIDDAWTVEKLRTVRGGVNGLLNNAEKLRQQTGNPKAHCVAAATAEIYNRGRAGAKRLPSWWRNDS